MQAIKATKVMLASLREAVKHEEQCWDAMRDLELEAGTEFDSLDEWVRDLAVMGSESVTLEMLQEFLDEQQYEKADEEEEEE